MSLIASSQSKDFEKPKPGTAVGTCFRVIDLGTQTSTYNNQTNRKRKVHIGYEVNQKMSDGKPFIVGGWYTLSLSENATLRAILEGWRGAKFTKEDAKGFDLKKLLTKSCMLSLVENGDYINIDSTSKLMDGIVPEPLVNPVTFFSLDEFDQDVFNGLPDSFKDKIRLSPEYQKATGQQPEAHTEHHYEIERVPDFDDSIPF